MKYICITNWKEELDFGSYDSVDVSDCIITFPNDISHKHMFDTLKEAQKDINVISAGFVMLDKNRKPFCTGKSQSLNVESRGDIDTILLNVSF